MQGGTRIKYPDREEIFLPSRKAKKIFGDDIDKQFDDSSRIKNAFKHKRDDIRYVKLRARLTDYEFDSKCSRCHRAYTWRKTIPEKPPHVTLFTPILLTKANMPDDGNVWSFGEISDEDCENQPTKADLQKGFEVQEKKNPSSARIASSTKASKTKPEKRTKKRVKIDITS